MPTPQRTLIRNDVAAALRGIVAGAAVGGAIGGVYKTSIKTVEQVERTWTWTTVQPSDRPFIGIMSGPDNDQHLMYQTLRRTWVMQLHMLVDAADGLAKQTALDNLEDDVIAALSASTMLNGTDAMMVTYKETDTDDTSDPLQGYMKRLIEVVYWRATGET